MAFDRSKALKAAQKHLAKGNLDKAVVEYERLAADDPDDARVLLKLGDLHGKKGDKAKACAAYRKVADRYAEQGFFLKAVAIFKQIVKIDGSQLEAWEKLAEMYELLSLISDALSTYEYVANAYTKAGNTPRALDAMGKMAQLDPENVAVTIKYAEALSKVHRRQEAVEAFLQGATVLKRQGRLDDYVKVTERLLYHQPDNAEVARELASLYLDRSDPKHALAKLQVCFKADPKDLATLDLLARAFEQLEQSAKAVSVYREMQRILEAAGDVDGQVDALHRLLALEPDDADAREMLAELTGGKSNQQSVSVPVIDLGDTGEAPDDEDDDIILVDDEDSDVIPLVNGGSGPLSDVDSDEDLQSRIERMMGECDAFIRYKLNEKVEAQLRAVLTLDPGYVTARVKLGNFYADAGRNGEAAEQYVAAARTPGVDPSIARQYLELAAELDPSNRDAMMEERPTTEAHRVDVATPAPPQDTPSEDGEEDDIIFLDDDLGDDTEPDLAVEDADDILFDDEPIAAEPAGGEEAAFFGQEGALDAEPEMVLEEASDEEVELIAQAQEEVLRLSARPSAPQAAFSSVAPEAESPNDQPTAEHPAFQSLSPLISSAPPTSQQPSTPTSRPPAPTPMPPAAAPTPAPPASVGTTPPPQTPTLPPQTPPPPTPLPQAGASSPEAPTLFPQAAPTPIPGAPTSPPPSMGTPTPVPGNAPPSAATASVEAEELDEDLEETIEEATFYRDQGLTDEAIEAVQEALFCYPNHPALVALMRELTGQDNDVGDDDQSFALAETLAQEAESAPSASQADAGAVAVDDVLAKFKAGVEKAVDKDDAATHYDLGIAYMEMGLHNEAIGEFELCLNDPTRQCQAHTMIAFSHVSEGKMLEAIEHFKAALEHDPADSERMELWFELGNAHELLGKTSEALVYYEKVEEEDPNYRDVALRIERLGVPPTPKDEDDEFDAMFDNMILKD